MRNYKVKPKYRVWREDGVEYRVKGIWHPVVPASEVPVKAEATRCICPGAWWWEYPLTGPYPTAEAATDAADFESR